MEEVIRPSSVTDAPPEPSSSFSTKLPFLQLYLDSTSLGTFLICPRKYELSVIRGKVPTAENTHLTFGILVHKGLEIYHKARFNEQSHRSALRTTVRWALEATWEYNNNRPWTPSDDTVGRIKNRYSLIRTLVWYLNQYNDDGFQTAIVNNQPAVEIPFTLFSGHIASTGEDFYLCGFLDRIIVFQGKYFITDVKTTGHSVDDKWFAQFSPNTQMTIYSLAGHAVFNLPIEGVMVDGCEINVESGDFSKKLLFRRRLIPRNREQLEEWQQQLGYWLMQLNQCAETQTWPKNESACGGPWGGCVYRGVCSKNNKKDADDHLDTYYQTRTWDPLARRSDI